MSNDEREELALWADRWKETGEILEKLRRDDIRKADLTKTIPLFDNALRSALWLGPPKAYSGLIEFHRKLSKIR